MVDKIIVTYMDGHCAEFINIVDYSDDNCFLTIVCKWDFPKITRRNTSKINLSNIIGYTICMGENKEEKENG